MINAGHLDSPWQEQQAILRYPLPTIGIAAIMVGLATAGLASSLPAFSPVFNTPLFSFFSEINQMVGLIVSLYAAYRWHPTVGMDGILLFFVANVPYIYMNFPDNLPELMNLAFVALVALMGIWLIAELRRAVELAQQREQELKAVAVLNTKVLNQRIQFLEDSNQKSEQIDCLQRAISIAGGGNTPLEVAREFLHLVHEETMAG